MRLSVGWLRSKLGDEHFYLFHCFLSLTYCDRLANMGAFSCSRSFTLVALSFITLRHSFALSIDSPAAAILRPRLDGGAVTTGAGTWKNATSMDSPTSTTTSSSDTATMLPASPTTTEHTSIYLTEILSGYPSANATTEPIPLTDSQPSAALSSVISSSTALSVATKSSKRKKCKPSTSIPNIPSQAAGQPSIGSIPNQAANVVAASVSFAPAVASAAASSGQTGNENSGSGSPAAGGGAPAVCNQPATVTVTTQYTVTVTVTAQTANSSPISDAVAAPVAVHEYAAPGAAGGANSPSINNMVASPAPINNNGEAAPAAVTSAVGAAPASINNNGEAAPAAVTSAVAAAAPAFTSTAIASKSYKTTCKHRTKRRTSNATAAATSTSAQNVEATAAASASALAGSGESSSTDTPVNIVELAATLGSLPATAAQEASAQPSIPGWQSSGGIISSVITQSPLSSKTPMPATSSMRNATWSPGTAWQASNTMAPSLNATSSSSAWQSSLGMGSFYSTAIPSSSSPTMPSSTQEYSAQESATSSTSASWQTSVEEMASQTTNMPADGSPAMPTSASTSSTYTVMPNYSNVTSVATGTQAAMAAWG